jgi:ADP-heptose:LPS heptosyltransferase
MAEDLDFLHACALDKNRPLTETEQAILHTVRNLLKQADEIIICLGGKAGRLGECIVGTALLEGTLQALHYMNKADIPVYIFVDEGVINLFDEKIYQNTCWPSINVIHSEISSDVRQCMFQFPFQSLFQSLAGNRRTQVISGRNTVVLDFHGANDGMPYLQFVEHPLIQQVQGEQDQYAHVAILGQLFRVGVRSYAERGPERRYADFIETLFALPAGTIDGKQAQPRLLLSDGEDKRYYELAQAIGLNLQVPSVVCFFPSVVPAKCYERWDEVLQLLCEQLAFHIPGQKIDLVLVCGPDADLPEGIRKADIEEWLGNFQGAEANARVLICSTPSLRDLAILTSHAVLVLSNDTGPGHIAGALSIPTVTPFLPGNIYSQKVWSSTLYHDGVILDSNPYSFREVESAVIWGKTDIINRIEPQKLCAAAWKHVHSSLD